LGFALGAEFAKDLLRTVWGAVDAVVEGFLEGWGIPAVQLSWTLVYMCLRFKLRKS